MSSTTTTRPLPRPAPPADDLGVVAPALTSGRDLLLAPFTGATWRAVAQLVVAWWWLGAVGLTVVIVGSLAAGLIPLFGVGVLLLAGCLVVAGWFARVELARLAAQTGVVVPPAYVRRPRRPGFWAGLGAVLADGRRWTALVYAAVGSLLAVVAASVVLALGAAGLAAVLVPVYGLGPEIPDWLGVSTWPATLLVVGLGLLAVWLAAVVAQGTSYVLVALARGLLGLPRHVQAAAAAEAAEAAQRQAEVRAEHLQETRRMAVGAADDERRRIERDLHDGAQQRLVALGVELGAAKRRAATDPEAAAEALDHAHREVKETLAELRDLVRGIHPAVLTDRGLDAALSALAARSPVPVTVVVPDPASLGQAGPAAQAAAYFVVAEALTNTAKHAEARSARIDVAVLPDVQRLRLVVQDDGKGGARADAGSGLDGLRSRVAALDGSFDLVSPVGGGTRLIVEVPCTS